MAYRAVIRDSLRYNPRRFGIGPRHRARDDAHHVVGSSGAGAWMAYDRMELLGQLRETRTNRPGSPPLQVTRIA